MALEGAYAFSDIGSSVVADLSGNGRDIDLTGTNGAQVDGSSVLDGGALGKTGATMPVLPAALLTATETDDRTIMFDAVGNLTTWWVRYQKDAIGSGVWGVLNISGSMAIQARRESDDSIATRPTATAPSATRHNYCATYIRSTGVISIYYDGALAATSSFAAGTQLSVSADRIDLAEWSTTGPALDNLRFYSHALFAPEVAALAGTPVTATEITGTAASTAPAAMTAAIGAVTVSGTVASTAASASTLLAGSTAAAGAVASSAAAATSAAAGAVQITGTVASVAPAAVTALSSVVPAETPLERTMVIPAESRTLVVPAESRTLIVPAETRVLEVQ